MGWSGVHCTNYKGTEKTIFSSVHVHNDPYKVLIFVHTLTVASKAVWVVKGGTILYAIIPCRGSKPLETGSKTGTQCGSKHPFTASCKKVIGVLDIDVFKDSCAAKGNRGGNC